MSAGWTVWSHDLSGGETLGRVAERADRVVAHLVHAEAMGTAAVSVPGWERDNRVVARWNHSWHLGLEEGL